MRARRREHTLPPRALTRPPPAALDASRPWLVFWITHSLALLEVPLPDGAPLPMPPPAFFHAF